MYQSGGVPYETGAAQPAPAAVGGLSPDTLALATALGALSPRARVHELLALVEREFDALHAENTALRARLGLPPAPAAQLPLRLGATPQVATAAIPPAPSYPFLSAPQLRAGQNAGKTPPRARWTPVGAYAGHRDGVWEVTACPGAAAEGAGDVLATASVDRSARVWSTAARGCVFVYFGHRGSVNSVRPSPGRDRLLCTASGDRTCHVFRIPTSDSSAVASGANNDGNDGGDDDKDEENGKENGKSKQESKQEGPACFYQKTPLLVLRGHKGAVIGADWLRGAGEGGEQLVSAAWDGTVRVWSTATGATVAETSATAGAPALTAEAQRAARPAGVAVHPRQPLVLVAGGDGACRLWDVRVPGAAGVTTVAAHSRAGCVGAVCDAAGDHVVTTGADRRVRVWDLRAAARTPRLDVRGSAAVARPTVSSAQLIVVPQDGGSALLIDLTGRKHGKVCFAPGGSSGSGNSFVTGYTWARDERALFVSTFGGSVIELHPDTAPAPATS